MFSILHMNVWQKWLQGFWLSWMSMADVWTWLAIWDAGDLVIGWRREEESPLQDQSITPRCHQPHYVMGRQSMLLITAANLGLSRELINSWMKLDMSSVFPCVRWHHCLCVRTCRLKCLCLYSCQSACLVFSECKAARIQFNTVGIVRNMLMRPHGSV